MKTKKRPCIRSRMFGIAVLVLTGIISVSAEAIPVKVALIHSNPVLLDVDANLTTLESLVEEAFLEGANIVITPELSTTGFCITRNQVITDLGFTDPYPELDPIRGLAIQHQGYVVIAIAEVALTGEVYNTAVIFGPGGFVTRQHKRAMSGWHDRGILPFDVITTPYGDIAPVICSDSYLPDLLRIVTLKGADLILLPANWWGQYGQEEIWQTRARENGLWIFVANRWGTEIDERWGFPYTYYMDDAPSVVITPDGSIQLIHRAEDDPVPSDKILYYTVDVPQYRIGSAYTPVYSVNYRRPEAYGEIANLYYRPDLGNQPAPNLPSVGVTHAASLSYKPKPFSPSANLVEIERIYLDYGGGADIIVLPGLGVTSLPVNSSDPDWYAAAHWDQLQDFVENNGLTLLVTTMLEYDPGLHHLHHTLVLVQPGQLPLLHRQTHDSLLAKGSGAEPVILDLPHARIGILTGRDALFPETATHLAKSGIDILIVSSTVGAPVTSHNVNSPNYSWKVDALLRLWKTRTDHVFHLVASDWTGSGVVIENTYGLIGRCETVDSAYPLKMLDLDSSFVRTKYLNAYYSFDLDILLGTD